MVHDISKGDHINVDSYSIVKNNIGNLFSKVPDYIKKYNIEKIFMVGVATDFCVLFSARDIKALFPNIEVYIVSDATLAIGSQKDALNNIINKEKGILLISTEELLKKFEKTNDKELLKSLKSVSYTHLTLPTRA